MSSSMTCRICHRHELLDPRVLSCSHAFCRPCLREWLVAGHGTAAVVLCPFCRSSCPLPEGGVRALPSWAPVTGSPTTSLRRTVDVQPETTAARRARSATSSVSLDGSIVSEDDEPLTAVDWQTQMRKDLITVYNETYSALAEAPKPRLLWRLGWRRLAGPYDVAFLPDKRGLVVVETTGKRVSLFSCDGSRSEVIADHLDPGAVAVSEDGGISVTDTMGGRVVVITEGRQPEQWVPKGLIAPQGIACKSNGGWAITDAEQHTLAIYTSKGRLLRRIGGYGEGTLNFSEPMYVTCDDHNRILVSDCENHSVKVFDPSGERFLFKIGGCQSDMDGLLNFPYGVCIDRRNNILVADYGNARVSAFSPDGRFIRHLMTSDDVIRGPRGLAYEGEGPHSAKLAVTGCWMQKLWVHRVVEF